MSMLDEGVEEELPLKQGLKHHSKAVKEIMRAGLKRNFH